MNISTCNSNRIDDFLANDLSDAEQAAFERHLDGCAACCTELQKRTADVAIWENVRRFLNSSGSEGHDASHDDALSHPRATRESDFADPPPIANVDPLPRLDFLGATDDPRMVGRFAGYEISGVVGCGGMGIVLKGFDSALNRYAAIKVLSPHFASSGASRLRFAREAQAAAAVVHDNVIAIHGVSEFNGLPYLVMPYVKGISLQKRIDRGGPLSIEEILRIAMQTARGLAAAHDQGLVHRDIKPGNILLPENVERVVITDFGLARAADDASLTRSGVIAGTPQYMSPEQARGDGVDCRSDLFSLGCVMYAMAVGHSPFRAETPYGILRRITDTVHRPLRQLRSDIPGWLCLIVDRLLEKNAADRFVSASDVATLLEDCLAHVQQPGQVPLPTGVTSPRGRAHRFGTRRVLLLSLLIVLCAGLSWHRPWATSNQISDKHGSEVSTTTVASVQFPIETVATHSAPSVAKSEVGSDAELSWQVDSSIDDFEFAVKELAVTFANDGLENSESKGVHE